MNANQHIKSLIMLKEGYRKYTKERTWPFGPPGIDRLQPLEPPNMRSRILKQVYN